MKEITENTGVNNSTVLYYISLGLLPEPIRTSKNMAYYPESYLRIIPIILSLKEKMHLPLGIIKQLFENIGHEKLTIDNALHYYETFLQPFEDIQNHVNYNEEEFRLNTYLNDDEIYELKDRKMILPATERSYYYDDVLAAKAYKKLKDMGIPLASMGRLAIIINKLANEIHEIFHENILSLKDDELEITKVFPKEFDLVFSYLLSKYLQTIFKKENT